MAKTFNALGKIEYKNKKTMKIKSLQYKITSSEKKKYVLSTDADFEILTKCKQIEKFKLANEDKFLVKLIKTQLYKDWRKPLLKTLNQIFKKYNKR